MDLDDVFRDEIRDEFLIKNYGFSEIYPENGPFSRPRVENLLYYLSRTKKGHFFVKLAIFEVEIPGIQHQNSMFVFFLF